MDRYLSLRVTTKDKLQLVAVASLLVASKFEDQWAPLIRDLVYVGSRSFTAAEVKSMERTVLNTLQFEISVPTIYPFLMRAAKAANFENTHSHLPSYIAEVALHSYALLKYPPSIIAASVVAVSLRMTKNTWSSACASTTGCQEAALIPCMQEINALLKEIPAEVKTVRNKYTGSTKGNVSTIRPVDF